MESLEIYDSHVDAIKAHQDGHTLRLQWESRCKAAEEVIKYIGNYFEFPLTKICYENWQSKVQSMEGK